MTTTRLIASFVASLEQHIAERINTRLRDLLALGLVNASAQERAAVRKWRKPTRPANAPQARAQGECARRYCHRPTDGVHRRGAKA